jgi:hypothetical protein
MTSTTRALFRAAIVAIAPVVMLAGFVYHPYIPNLTDNTAVAEALVADTTRWGLSHLAVAVGSGLLMLAFLAIRSYLREAGEERWSAPAIPFIIIGSTLFALLPAMEIGMLGAAGAATDVAAAQTAVDSWFLPVLLTGGVLFLIGVIGLAKAITTSGVLGPRLTRVIVGALVVMALARFVPLGIQLYVGGAAGIIALWPLAYAMWAYPRTQHAPQPQPIPAS